jgi:hypothetical protein
VGYVAVMTVQSGLGLLWVHWQVRVTCGKSRITHSAMPRSQGAPAVNAAGVRALSLWACLAVDSGDCRLGGELLHPACHPDSSHASAGACDCAPKPSPVAGVTPRLVVFHSIARQLLACGIQPVADKRGPPEDGSQAVDGLPV